MVTIILPVSRKTYLQRVFTALELLVCDTQQTKLFVYVDGDVMLYQTARNLTQASKFSQKVCIYRKKGQPNVGSIHRRRQRIADIHNEIRQEIQSYDHDSDYLLLIEDDTLIPPQTITRLQAILTTDSSLAMVSGLELGRWGYYHLGAWVVDDLYTTQRIRTIEKPIQEQTRIDACGLYCCLVHKKLYIDHVFKPYDMILGPDVEFCLWLRQKGYSIAVLSAIVCVHITQVQDIRIENHEIDIVECIKEGDTWTYHHIEGKT